MDPPEQPTLSEIKTEKEQAGVNQALLLVMGAVQEGHDLCAGAFLIRTEDGERCSDCDIMFDRPQHSIDVVGVCGYIGKRIGHARCRRLLRAPQEGDDLRAGAGGVGAEHGVAGALGDAVLHSPQDSIMVVAASRNVGKGHNLGLGGRRTGSAPQEGDSLRAGAVAARVEGRGARAAGNALAHSPDNSILIVGACGHVDEGILAGGGSSLVLVGNLLTVTCLPTCRLAAELPKGSSLSASELRVCVLGRKNKNIRLIRLPPHILHY